MADDRAFRRALEMVLKQEGGYVNDPDDPGGATNFGVTQSTYNGYRLVNRLSERPVREITQEEVAEIYRVGYWLDGKCPELPSPLAVAHFDACVNHGVKNAAKLLQRALGVKDDGAVGPITLRAAQVSGGREICRYLLERVWFYDSIVDRNPRQAKFLTGGWISRLQALYRELIT